MLIENGAINWRLKPSASSRKLRNGVGIDKQGRVVFMLSERETNFYDFACYAQSKLHVRQMLYLDGTISKKCIKRAAAYRGNTIRSSP